MSVNMLKYLRYDALRTYVEKELRIDLGENLTQLQLRARFRKALEEADREPISNDAKEIRRKEKVRELSETHGVGLLLKTLETKLRNSPRHGWNRSRPLSRPRPPCCCRTITMAVPWKKMRPI